MTWLQVTTSLGVSRRAVSISLLLVNSPSGAGKVFSHGVRVPAVILLQGRPEEAESGSRGLVTSLVTLPCCLPFYTFGSWGLLREPQAGPGQAWPAPGCQLPSCLSLLSAAT